jgi:hypothetical protein
MELEEMKTLWEEMSTEIEKQKKLTDSIIIKMTQSNYRNKLNKILIPETISAVVAFGMVLYLLINLQKLNTWYLMACGIICVLILTILPVLSIRAIRKIHSLNISGNNYRQSLLEYSKGKIRFVFIQKLSLYLGAMLMVVSLPVMSQLIFGKDMFTGPRLWMSYVIGGCVIGFPFFYYFARRVFKCYVKTATDAEIILKELDI